MKITVISLIIVASFTYPQKSYAQKSSLDSLFQRAVEKNNVDEVRRLLNLGANVNKAFDSDLKPTPLMYASAFADGKILKIIINEEALLDEVDVNGDPAINWAAYYGHVNNIKRLIEAGANIHLASKHGNALDVAFRLWHADSVINVFRGTALEEEISSDVNQLIEAIRKQDRNIVEALIKKGVSVDSKDGLGMSALHHAVRIADEQMVALLLEKGANPNALNRVGQTPLTIAARFGQLAIANTLIDKGADVNIAGKTYRLTPLIGAAVGGNEDLVLRLIDEGAIIDQKDVVNQCTALHWAIFYKNTVCAKILIEKGASITKKCLDNTYTAYTLARSYPDKEITRFIESKRAKHPIIGSWKLKTINYIYRDTTYSIQALQGNLLIGVSRYSIMYNPTDKVRTPFENLSKPTGEEILAGFKSIVFNSGWYELEENVLVATPDIAKVPGFEGGKQYYRFEVFEEQLRFRLFDETYQNGEKPEWYGKVEVELTFSHE